MVKVKYQTGTSSGTFSAANDLPLSKNFVLSELANMKGDTSKEQYLITDHSREFNEMFQLFRERYRNPINPTSGFRQEEFNKQVGGSSNSLHLYACAVDFVDRYNKQDFWMISEWLRILFDHNVIGAANIYNNSGNFRYHFGAFSDVYQGHKENQILVYTNYDHYQKINEFYAPLGVKVYYYGDL